jgi:hypothetical protein
MIDIETIKDIITEFAEKYNFIQQKDIEKVETSDFNRENYLKIDDKIFIVINEYTNKTEIVCGKIIIEIDSIEEEEWYYIEKKNHFSIDILDYLNKYSLIEEIIKECKNYKLI